jgi:hypothetical protein
MSRLSDSQLVVLTAACQRADRCVFPVTAKLKGNAAGNVLKSLLKKDLIKEVRAKNDDTVWRHDEQRGRMTLVATKAAFAALGIDPRDEAEDAEADAADLAPAKVEAKPSARPKTPKSKEPKEPRAREGSKQAQLISMLRRAKGATIDEVVKALEWQPHTVRGAIAGALKKKLGLDVTSEKDEKRGRIYRIPG